MMNLKGNTMVFRNKSGYSTTISKKDGDDYTNLFIPLRFSDNAQDKIVDLELEHMDQITLEHAWLTFFETKKGESVVVIFVNDFEIIANDEDDEDEDEDELPFERKKETKAKAKATKLPVKKTATTKKTATRKYNL